MKNKIYEIVKEYQMYFNELDFPVKGKILKSLDENGNDLFSWRMSHVYKPGENAGFYRKDGMDKNFETVERSLKFHMESFTAKWGVEQCDGF